jgi:hypothetical protein
MHPDRPEPHPYADRPLAELLGWSEQLRARADEWAAEARRLFDVTQTPEVTGSCARALAVARDELMAQMRLLSTELHRRADELERRSGSGAGS